MTVNCEIRYENSPQGIFYVGQTLAGSVALQLTEPESVNGIYIKIEGFTAVHWSERRPQGQRRRSRHFTARQDYLNVLTYLVGAEHGPAIALPQGTHIHSFGCPLPVTLPTSFEGQYGHIRYTITVFVDRPSKKSTTYREAFTVLRNVNLNDDPSLWNPRKLELSKTFGWWIFKSDPLNITVEVPLTGFVPGQSIPVVVQWDNNSSAYIHGIRIKLYKNELYSATDPYEKEKTDQQSVAKIENREVHKQGQVRFERSVLVPSLPPTSKSQLITISYELMVYVHISSGDHPVFTVPITIGTIPLMGLPPRSTTDDSNDQPPPPHPPSYGFNVKEKYSDESPSKSGVPTVTQTASPSAPSTSQAPMQPNELPPPTYEEATNSTATNLQDQDLQDDDDSTEQERQAQPDPIGFKPFIPRYPVYNFDGPGPSKQ